MTSLENSLLLGQIELLDKILAASTDHIYVFNRMGQFLYASPAGLAALGLKASDLLGKTGHELNFPVDVMERHDIQRELVFETGIPIKAETLFPTVQGNRHYEYVISPILAADGTIQAVMSTVHDITERKQAENALYHLTEELEARVQTRTQELVELNESLQIEIAERRKTEQALQASEAKLSQILNNASASIVSFQVFADRTWQYDYYSAGCEAVFGYTAAEMMTGLWWSRLPPEDQETMLQFSLEAICAERPVQMEYRFQHKDGALRWISHELSSHWDSCHECWQVIAVDTDITDRKRAELALKTSEARFLELSEASPANIYIIVRKVDGSFYFEHISRAIETIHEVPVEQFLKDASIILNHIHPEDRTGYELAIKHSLETLQPFSHEWRIITPSGTIKWVQDNSCPKLRDNGDIAWYGAVIDITARKQAEAKLQERENLLHLFAQYVPAGIAMFDREMRYIMASERWADYHRVSLEALIGRSHYEAFPEISTAYQQVHQRCLAGAIETCDEDFFILPDGTPRWARWEIHPWYTATNEIGGIIIFAEDITQRRQAELSLQELNQSLEHKVVERTAELRASESQIRQQADREALLREITQRIRQSLDLQTIFDTACQEILQWSQAERVGIFQFEPDSQFDDGKFVAEAVLPGFSSILVTPIHDHCFGDRYAPLYQQGRIQVTQDIYAADLQACHRDVLAQFQIRANLVVPLLQGHILWGLLCIHQCSAPRQWQSFEIQVAQEITSQLEIAIQQASLFEQLQQQLMERQQAQQLLTERNQQLAISNQELARATRLKDEFLANMSHELRTPLNAILGMTEGLQDQIFGEVNEKQLKALQTVERAGLHLLTLINDILDLAKIESGQIQLNCTPIAITTLCHSSIDFIKQQAYKKQIHFELKLPSNLPDLVVDERRIRQALVNLLNNAVKFTPNGGRITLEISLIVGQQEEESWLRFAVMDTGIGIAPEEISKLFQPFIQIDSALNRQYEGTGLGLALVKRIVELHGGRIGLTSEVGLGSCFTIDLPIEIANLADADRFRHVDSGLALPDVNHAAQPLILLGEDNENNIATMTSYLEAIGHRLLVARNGQEAIALTQHESPDLIVMDIQMPEMDGLEAIQQIRRLPNLEHIPIIALTALVMEGDQERCLAAGANAYLSKPVKLKQLAVMIQQFLSSDSVTQD